MMYGLVSRILYLVSRTLARVANALPEEPKTDQVFYAVDVSAILDAQAQSCIKCSAPIGSRPGTEVKRVAMLGDEIVLWFWCPCEMQTVISVRAEEPFVILYPSERALGRARMEYGAQPKGHYVIGGIGRPLYWLDGEGGLCRLEQLSEQHLLGAFQMVRELLAQDKNTILIHARDTGDAVEGELALYEEGLRREIVKRRKT